MAIDHTSKDELKDLLRQAVAEVVEPHLLTDDEIKWVRMAIKAQAERAEFRKAVIEKTFIGLLTTASLAFVAYFLDFLKTHWKP